MRRILHCTITLALLGSSACASQADDPSVIASSDTETGGEDDEGDPSCAEPLELPEDVPAPIPWQPLGELTIDDQGLSSTLSVPLLAGQRYLALRTVPLDGASEDNALLCHDLLEARLGDGTSLIPDLLSGGDAELLDEHQRSYPGPGAGVFVLPSALAPLAGPDTLELRIQLRDCALGVGASRLRFPDMATRVRVDAAQEPTPLAGASARLAVRLLVAEDSGWGTLASDPALAQLWATAVDRFADVGVTLELEAEGSIPAVGELRYQGDMLPLRSLHEQALACLRDDAEDERFVPVVLVPCLRFEDPIQMTLSVHLGQTPHIPGAFDETTSPSLVVLAAGACDDGPPAPSASPERHGLVLAHELGHYLGLHHADQPLGQHLAADTDEQLMHSGIAIDGDPATAWFSPAQAEVLLRHPDITFE